MTLIYLTIDELVYEMTETDKSDWIKVPVKLTTVRVRMFFRTGDTEFGVIDVTTAGPELRLKDWLVSLKPLIVIFMVTFVAPDVNCSGTHDIIVELTLSTSQGVPSLNYIVNYVPSFKL
jgi:hypothetical protein